MCGRYSLSVNREKLIKQFDIEIADAITPNYNVAPSQLAAVVTNDNPLALQFFKWGLIPYWSKTEKLGYNLINARKEGLASKSSFRIPLRKRRCLVLADSFYEWKKIGKSKYPYRILLQDDSILAFAGLWDFWQDTTTKHSINSFTIITTPPNNEMEPIHNRMPAILKNRDQQMKWLEDGTVDEHLTMLKPLEDGLLKSYRISTQVNSVKNNLPEIHKEVDDRLTLFD